MACRDKINGGPGKLKLKESVSKLFLACQQLFLLEIQKTRDEHINFNIKINKNCFSSLFDEPHLLQQTFSP